MGKRIDLSGERFGKLIVLEQLTDNLKNTKCRCKCDCGNEIITLRMSLKKGDTRSCGCLRFGRKIPKRKPDLQRFLEKIDKTDSCWNWKGYINKLGYGHFWLNGQETAHRSSWILHNGNIPENMCVCHKCDNPKCVNPDHLFVGSYKDNTQDMIKKGRKGIDPNIIITKEKAKEVVELYRKGMKQRDIAKLYGINQANIWKHIHKEIPSQGKAFGEKNCNAKLTKEKVAEMRKMHVPYKVSYSKIAKIFDVDVSTAERAIKGKTWAS